MNMIRKLLTYSWQNASAADANPNQIRLFRRHIEKEMARVDRKRSESFALLTFRFQPARLSRMDARTVFQSFSEQLRVTDEPGWVPSRQIAVLLRDTDRPGATLVARRLNEILTQCHLSSRFELTVYPGNDSNADPSELQDRSTQAIQQPGSCPVVGNPVLSDLLQSRTTSFTKRAVDIVGAITGLTLASPVILTAGVLIKWTSPGPVFFSQQREGKDGQHFTMYKLRTMRADADQLQQQFRHLNEQDGPSFKIQDDPRITPIGKFLRGTCLDELPQLWNVLRGEMSLVGPRPLPIRESRQCLPWQRNRLRIKPGLTCFWQLDGGTKVTFDQWMRMDLQYVKRQGVFTDLNLIFQTILTVLHLRPGKDAPAEVTYNE